MRTQERKKERNVTSNFLPPPFLFTFLLPRLALTIRVRGHPFMTSATFSDFVYPLPHFHPNYRLVRKKGPVLLSISQVQPGRSFSQLSYLSFAQPCTLVNSLTLSAFPRPPSPLECGRHKWKPPKVGSTFLPFVLPLLTPPLHHRHTMQVPMLSICASNSANTSLSGLSCFGKNGRLSERAN